MSESDSLHRVLREIFHETLRNVDAGDAVLRALSLKASSLQVLNSTINLNDRPVYSIAIGKAARPMASALTEILGGRLAAGVISVPSKDDAETLGSRPNHTSSADYSIDDRWLSFSGGHPLPNQESLDAARAAFALLHRADDERAVVIFLISGGGSAMIEMPRDESISLEDLRRMNEALVSCGAGIEEINVVRRSISAVKGGGLAARVPNCDQISLIVSDTGPGAESTVASGPSFAHPINELDASAVITRYGLEPLLPQSVLRVIEPASPTVFIPTHNRREHYVLLDNRNALEAAAEAARKRGFAVEIAQDVVDQPIVEGCSSLLANLLDLRHRPGNEGKVVCLISGGEFACPVRGHGVGGRNAESALRWAIEMDAIRSSQPSGSHIVALSAGTDGIDGNSAAAGAIADETTVGRARRLNLDARRFLEESDASSFFHALGDTIITGPTETNVRDVRILLMG